MRPGEIALLVTLIAWHGVVWPMVVILGATAVRRRRSEPRFAIVASALAVVSVAWSLVFVFDVLNPAAQGESITPVVLGASFVALPVLLGTYPDGRFTPRWLAVPALTLSGFGVVAIVTKGTVIEEPWWRAVGWATLLLLAGQIYRYRRRATTAERESVRWVVLSMLVALSGCVGLLVGVGTTIEDDSPALVHAVGNLVVLAIPVGLLIGLLRPRLLDVDVALRVVVSGLVLLAAVGIPYWATTTALEALGTEAPAAGRIGALAGAAAAVAAARFAGAAADWLVYRGRPDPGRAVRDLGRALAEEPDAARVPAVVLRAVVDALSLDGAELRGDGVLRARVRTVGDPEFAIPVTYQDERLATLVVSPRRGETSLTRRDTAVLRRLALHAAPALHGARALAELSEARSRVVRLRAEERKALRRDIHDDLAPTLAGLGLSAAAVAALVRDGDPEAAAVADTLVKDVNSAMAQTRELTHDLRPPILDDEGLVATVRARVQRVGGGLRVRIDAPANRLVLAAAVEIAALRIVQEAVSNVRRHARATECTVRLALVEEALEITVTDDGVGFPAVTGRGKGIGLASMRERAHELGGTAFFGAAPGGGARVHVSLPSGPTPHAAPPPRPVEEVTS
ncbi:ATP-binding protein [Sphaerimonospora mesophila]|uniref:sensor histidine kinase n=1 Tax=Sphaerimonospora mesophila TaxID=37483 RepID=UPI0006E20065